MKYHTTGFQARFATDSRKIYVKWVPYSTMLSLDHMPATGVSGVDIYVRKPGGKWRYAKTGRIKSVKGAGVSLDLTNEVSEVIVNFPLYNGVEEVLVGLDEGAVLKEAPDYTYEKPIVYYGSSITQGCSASRPGMAYEAIIERTLDSNYINLGFSGAAKGEDAMADYIAGLDMSLFVYDYDYNAPSCEHLAATHEKMFLKIREKNPKLPIVMITRPRSRPDPDRDARKEIIKRTYDNAVSRGDKNVYILYGSDLFDGLKHEYTIDDCHPTDLGLWFMAQGIIPTLRKIIAAETVAD
jgi:hypothetical protein